MKEFIKKHYLLVTNIVCAIIVSMCFFGENIAACGLAVPLLAMIFFCTKFLIILAITVFFFTMNIVAYNAVEKNESKGIIPAVFGGAIGAFAAVHTVNRSYRAKKIINIIFTVFVWFCVWIAVSFLLYEYGYYNFSWFNS